MSYTCPQCKQPLIRVRRKKSDRLLSSILPTARFQCVLHTCRWNGLKLVKREELKPARVDASSLPNTKFRKDSI